MHQPTSTLAQAHPDHPTLANLDLTQSRTASQDDQPGDEALQSPPQTQTPQTLSDAGSEIGSPQQNMNSQPGGGPSAVRRPGNGPGPTMQESPNARSKSITVASGNDTFGALNCHPASASTSSSSGFRSSRSASSTSTTQPGMAPSFRVGVSEDRNRKCRRTMEDAHSFVYDFGGIRGQGYFAVFDGHAGKHAAEWCGQNFHEYLLDAVLTHPDAPIPDLLNTTFHTCDSRLSHLAQTGNTHSGCTAVTAFLRVEEEDSGKGFTNPNLEVRGLLDGKGEEELEAQTANNSSSSSGGTLSNLTRRGSGRRIRDFVKGLTSSSKNEEDEEAIEDKVQAVDPKTDKKLKRVLYTANVGDARAVLCRNGKAVRLTYDHKGSDSQEAKRITDAGGFVMNNRVNGVLAVTRSLGDASMKEFVVGSPYTTETVLDHEDEFLIVACDGLWDVAEDQEAVDLIRSTQDPQEASKKLLDFAMSAYSTDNLSVMVIRFYTPPS